MNNKVYTLFNPYRLSRFLPILGTLAWAMLGILCPSQACTTAVIAAHASHTGKPMLWKMRDTETLRNRVQRFSKGSVHFVALVNADSTSDSMVWAGINSLGFGIMNSASFNTNLNDTSSFQDQEGIIMRRALEQCATLADFEKLLKSLPTPWGLNANFGVIDAQGGAAYYETDNYHFEKFDANDPRQAPNGVLIRTNFSYTGQPNKGYGYIRMQTAQNIINNAVAQNKLSLQLFTQDLGRCLINSLTQEDFCQKKAHSLQPLFINSSDLLCRYGSASNIVIEGTTPQYHQKAGILWASTAFPIATVAIPYFVAEVSLPSALSVAPTDSAAIAPLTQWGLTLMNMCYPISRGSGTRYMNITPYHNSVNGGFGNDINRMENLIIELTYKLLADTPNHKIPPTKALNALYSRIDSILIEGYAPWIKSKL